MSSLEVTETRSGTVIVRSIDVPFYSGGKTELEALNNFADDLRSYIAREFVK